MLVAPGQHLTGVSCVDPGTCVAVDASGGAVTFDGTSWSARTQVTQGSGFEGLSCPTSTFCAAVTSAGDAYLRQGSTWSGPTHVFVPATGMQKGLLRVACTSATFCLATDSNQLVYRYNGRRWSRGIAVPDNLRNTSCSSSVFCLGVTDGGGVTTYDGSNWSAAKYLDPNGYADAVSCVSSSFCVGSEHVIPDGPDNVLYYRSGVWSAPVAVAKGADNIVQLSCTATNFCVAVGNSTSSTFVFNGSRWVTMTLDSSRFLTSVSCTRSHFCATVDEKGYAVTTTKRTTSS